MPPRKQVDTSLFNTGLYVPTRTIFIDGHIDEKLAGDVVRGVHVLESLSSEQPINVYLCSGGGDIVSGLSIHDNLASCKSHVNILGHGKVNSCAVAILQAGDHRSLQPNTEIVLHAGYASIDEDNFQNTISIAKITETMFRRYIRIIAEKMGLTIDSFLDQYKWDKLISPQAAVSLGLADEVLQP